MAKKKAKRKLKRRFIGVGHPYFTRTGIENLVNEWPNCLVLLDGDFGQCKKTKTLRFPEGVGAWQKVKVYVEWY